MPSPLDPEVKASLVAAIELGEGVVAAAHRFGVNPSTASRAARDAALAAGLPSASRANLAELVAEQVRRMAVSLGTLHDVEAELFRNPEWVARLTGRDLAALAGVKSKEVRGWHEFAARHLNPITAEDDLPAPEIIDITHEF